MEYNDPQDGRAQKPRKAAMALLEAAREEKYYLVGQDRRMA